MGLIERFRSLLGLHRAINSGIIHNRFYETITTRAETALDEKTSEHYEYAFFLDNYMTDSEQYVVYSTMGRIYKLGFQIVNNDVVFSDFPQEVVVEHMPFNRSRTVLYRDKDNLLKFFGIASSATLNRNGEIDTTMMFDSFEDNFDPNNLPKLNLRHVQHPKFELGTVEGLFRLNNLLVTYGTIDETLPLGKYVESRISADDYGLSIEFIPLGLEDVDYDEVKIRTYTEGIFVGMALLPEKVAASNLTGVMIEKDEGEYREMALNKKQARKVLLDFIGDESAVDTFLEDVDMRERKIEEERMITRESEEVVAEASEIVEDVVVEEAVDEAAPEALIIDIEEELMEELDGRMREISETMKTGLEAQMAEIRSSVEAIAEQLTAISRQIVETQKSEEERVEKIVDEHPVNRMNARRAMIRKSVSDIKDDVGVEIDANSIANRRKAMISGKSQPLSKIE